VIPRPPPHVAKRALEGFMPFATEPAKQARYRAYLTAAAQPDKVPPPVRFARSLELRWQHAAHGSTIVPSAVVVFPWTPQTLDPAEESEFSRAASLFQPLSSMMANRFTSASAAPTHVLEPATVPVGLQSAEAMAQFTVHRALAPSLVN